MSFHQLGDNILTLASFLTPSECREFIAFAEEKEFVSADVDTGSTRLLRQDIRNNDRVNLHSEALATHWWEKLSSLLLLNIEGKSAIALSPHFRFYRYTPGQKFNMHKDGRQQVSGNTTLMTMLVYLNQDFSGGTTRFRQDNLEVTAVTGNALLFAHHLWHQGTKLESGCKYVLRTDVVFENECPSKHRINCDYCMKEPTNENH